MKYNFNKETKLYMIFDILGDTERTGPLLWDINRKRTEDVKNHILDLLLMVKLIKKYLPSELNFELIDDYIICHDLPEVITGDITKFEGVSEEEIKMVTNLAINWLNENFDGIMDFSNLFNGYENKIDIESKIVHMLDKIQSAIPFMKYQIEGSVDLKSPRINSNLLSMPFINQKISEGKDLADIFYEFHIRAVNITDEECLKYGINREKADLIVDVIRSFALSMYEQKKNESLLSIKKEFPVKAMKYNRNK